MAATAKDLCGISRLFHIVILFVTVSHTYFDQYALASELLLENQDGLRAACNTGGDASHRCSAESSNKGIANTRRVDRKACYWDMLLERQAMMRKAPSATMCDEGEGRHHTSVVGAGMTGSQSSDIKSGKEIKTMGHWDLLRVRQADVTGRPRPHDVKVEQAQEPELSLLESPEWNDGHVRKNVERDLAVAISPEAAEEWSQEVDSVSTEEGSRIESRVVEAPTHLDVEPARSPAPTTEPPRSPAHTNTNTQTLVLVAAKKFTIVASSFLIAWLVYWASHNQARKNARIAALRIEQTARQICTDSLADNGLVNASDAAIGNAVEVPALNADHRCDAASSIHSVPLTNLQPTAPGRIVKGSNSSNNCNNSDVTASISDTDRENQHPSGIVPTTQNQDITCNFEHDGNAASPDDSRASGEIRAKADEKDDCVTSTFEAATDTGDNCRDMHAKSNGLSSSQTVPITSPSTSRDNAIADSEVDDDASLSSPTKASKASKALVVAQVHVTDFAAARGGGSVVVPQVHSFPAVPLQAQQPPQRTEATQLKAAANMLTNAFVILQQQQQQLHQQQQQLQSQHLDGFVGSPWAGANMLAEDALTDLGPSPRDAVGAIIPAWASQAGLYGEGALVSPRQLQPKQLQLHPAERQMITMATWMVETLSTRMVEFVGTVAESTNAVRQLSVNLQENTALLHRLNSDRVLQEQRGWVMASMQRGMAMMWIVFVGGSLRLARFRDVAWTCGEQSPPRDPEFEKPTRTQTEVPWGIRLTQRSLGLLGWSVTKDSWIGWALGWLLLLLDRQRWASVMQTILCYCRELGLQTLGILMVMFVLCPLLRAILSVNMQYSWRIDIPMLLGIVWAMAGCTTVNWLGGNTVVFLAGWWLWCAAGVWLHTRPLVSSSAQVVALVMLTGGPVFIALTALARSDLPAVEALTRCWREGCTFAQWLRYTEGGVLVGVRR